jgi:F0F1-type ATP synthase membrane subunit c/vacuolar-type H+-ATPase subunit K
VGDEHADDDPGWPSIGLILLALAPGFGMQVLKRRTQGEPILMLRSVFLSFSGALVLFGVVLAFIGNNQGPTHVMPFLAILAVGAAFNVFAVRYGVKPLDCSSSPALAKSYRSRFFLVIAYTESVALFGFVFAFIGGPTWIYYVGAAFALFRFWTVVPPTRAGLQRDQDALNARGCELSLVAALRGRHGDR